MNRSEEINELAAALSAAQSEFSAVPKDSDNPFFKSKYADLAAVVSTAAPVLATHGLAVSQHLGFDAGEDTLTTVLLHKSGQFVADTMRLHLTKADAQGHGSATTYARRYAYMAALGLVADHDDDGNKAAAGASLARSQPSSAVARPQAADPTNDRLATAGERARMMEKVKDSGLHLPTLIREAGVKDEGALTLADLRAIKKQLDDAALTV